jgi:integrase
VNGRGMGTGRLEKVGEKWVGVWTDANGRRHRRALSTDRRVAERILADIIRRRDLEVAGLINEEGQERKLGEIRDRYLADLATYTKPAQVKRIGCVTKKLIDSLGDVRVRDVRVDAVLLYRQKRHKQGAAPRTVNLEVGGFKAMLTWATKAGLIGRNPITNLTPLPAGRAHEVRPRRAMTPDEIDRFLRASEAYDRDAEAHLSARPGQQARYGGRPRVPQTPLWRTLLYTGARWGELVATTWSDFDATQRTLRLRPETTKSRRQRIIPLVEAVVADLRRLRTTRTTTAGDPIFIGPAGRPLPGNETRTRWRFRQILKRAGIPEVDELGRSVVIHSTRHTFASELGRAGVGLVQAQRLLGHSTPELTAQVYTHLGIEDLRGAVEKLEPERKRRAKRGA